MYSSTVEDPRDIHPDLRDCDDDVLLSLWDVMYLPELGGLFDDRDLRRASSRSWCS